MKERPILFNAAMVRALLAGTKTQTRRVVKPQPSEDAVRLYVGNIIAHDMECDETGGYLGFGFQDEYKLWCCPYGKPGDRLWVRESHWWFKDEHDPETGYFPPKLTADDVEYRADGDDGRKVWRPSIHMPRWASRIALEITGVRVERLQDISEADALAEGVAPTPWPGDASKVIDWPLGPYRNSFYLLWESINGPGSWDTNPWVWVIEFRRRS